DRQTILDSTMERLVQNALLENRMQEKGKADFTDAEQEIMRSMAQSRYEQLWQGLYKKLRESNEDVTEKQVSEWMNEQGYTVDAIFREYRIQELQFRAFEMYCKDVTITTKDVAEYYENTYVAPDRERYEHDVPLYEQEMLLKNNEAFFVPEGYRYIKHILLAYPDELVEALRPYAEQLKAAQQNLQEAYQSLADAATQVAEMNDLLPWREAYDEAKAEETGAEQAYLDKREEALGMLRPVTDEIIRRYQAGERFENLMKEFSTDKNFQSPEEPGFPFHPASTNWPEAFRAAAAELEKVGDISRPVATDTGIHIIQYAGDMATGEHVLTDEEQKALEEAALYAARLERLHTLMETWKQDYKIETHPELITLK
ncbi:MAG: peptidylprolyl isomerase, partial [Clostridia bacterium]|nr:peptidylprolyl isomerase [Clostridia bacterium]